VLCVKLYVHSLVDELKWFCKKNTRCYIKIYYETLFQDPYVQELLDRRCLISVYLETQ